MSFLKNILGAFVEIKEGKTESAEKIESQTASESPAQDIPVPSGSAIMASSTAPIPPSTGSAINVTEYKRHFEDLIEEANTKNPLFAGTDFKEFIDSKADVDAITDEETKYKTAFNVLKRTGLTKEKLLSTGQEYLKIIDNDLSAFHNAFAQQYKLNVEQKEQLLQQKARELQLLNQKISTLNQEIKQVSQEVTESKQKMNSNRNLFTSAGEDKKKEIETELQKIKQYFSL